MGFIERLGLRNRVKLLQIESIDDELKNRLWNVYYEHLVCPLRTWNYGSDTALTQYFNYMWGSYFKKTIDSRSTNDNTYNFIRSQFFQFWEWSEIYHFIEYNISENLLAEVHAIGNMRYKYPMECNKVLEQEFAGWRFIDGILVPISNNVEIDELNAVFDNTSGFNSPYKNVNVHLKKSLDKMSDKKSPDYRNSIKEAISAVESICRDLTDQNTLGNALKELEKKGVKINTQFKAAIEKLYTYTNDKDTGIRHALIEGDSIPTFHEAKFMLVTCSAFINYLIGLGIK